jgi:alpha-1,2-mannosyltransferase
MPLNKSFNTRHFWAYLCFAFGLLLLVLELHSISGHIGSDFRIFYNAALRFNNNAHELYQPYSVRTLQGFLYPPPAVMLFVPFSLLPLDWSYRLFMVLLYVSGFSAMTIWISLSDLGNKAAAISRLGKINLVLLSAVSGPFFAAVASGQVDILVLLLCVAYVVLIVRGRPVLGGLVLAAGFWIKIYPIVLLAYALSRREALRILAGFAFGLIIVPLVLAPAVPLALYQVYFLDLLPKFSGNTIVNIYNQSLAAFYARLPLPLSTSIGSFQVYALPASIRLPIAAGAIAIAAGISIATRLIKPATIPLLAMIFAMFAIVAPLGWGHTYVYMLPLVCSAWLMGREIRSKWAHILIGMTYLVLLVPAYRRFPPDAHIFDLIYQIIYSRYLFSTILLMLISAMLIRINWIDMRRVDGRTARGKPGPQ